MRWDEQGLRADDGALPGLERGRIAGLLRTVETPDFAGMRFHEVLARSALNHVPGTSKRMPLAWTVNPYRGCSHACAYCVSPDTLILMGDGHRRRLAEVTVGDEIYGTEIRGRYRRYVRTRVLAKWRTRKRAYRITLADGTELVASGDHRFLSDRGWKHVRGSMAGIDQRPHLTLNDKLIGFGAAGLTTIAGRTTKSTADLRVIRIEDIRTEIEMIDITTGTGDFIANGVVAHNCFARPTHRYLDLDIGEGFDREIVVKTNVVEVLRRELAKPTWGREPVALGTNTDPYQRAEGRYQLMPGIIDALTESGTAFSILTKGTLLRRDLPQLVAAAERVPVGIAMSIAIYDDPLAASVEPGAPSAKARLATVRAAADLGLPVTVFLMPVLPYLTDTREHLERAAAMAAEAGAASAIYTALHLRPGTKEWYLGWLSREHPDLVPKYRAVYGDGAYAAKGYREWLGAKIRPILRAHGLERERPSTRSARSGTQDSEASRRTPHESVVAEAAHPIEPLPLYE